jgi:hypothetical protein
MSRATTATTHARCSQSNDRAGRAATASQITPLDRQLASAVKNLVTVAPVKALS